MTDDGRARTVDVLEFGSGISPIISSHRRTPVEDYSPKVRRIAVMTTFSLPCMKK
ncbi:hypothetical protein PFLU3_44390 [Pseudomonas fluorescens]|uniref:Uncharacterized protein n=1 Tax=Pseudomonas fluorescens TaxID=294 RepID=A0A0D0T913_PSEFL|nr:hypothetical protein PFLU3_44390 [Pseudomonas fluorescens]